MLPLALELAEHHVEKAWRPVTQQPSPSVVALKFGEILPKLCLGSRTSGSGTQAESAKWQTWNPCHVQLRGREAATYKHPRLDRGCSGFSSPSRGRRRARREWLPPTQRSAEARKGPAIEIPWAPR